MPEEGVPFTVIATISDPKNEQPIFNDMRQNLQPLGTQIADIRTAARITHHAKGLKIRKSNGYSCTCTGPVFPLVWIS